MHNTLQVFREYAGDYQAVGTLQTTDENTVFTYTSEYLSSPKANPLSLTLPLQSAAFSVKQTQAFFEGLLPEGVMRESLVRLLRAGTAAYPEILGRLNNESSGALIFSMNDNILATNRSYAEFSSEDLDAFSQQPQRVALDSGMASRLSLAGAQIKLGLYHKGNNPLNGWFIPLGSAPSTHILKAADGSFPHQTINEALCLIAARNCGFNVARCFLIPTNSPDPLLAVERFDRIITDDAPEINGCKIPKRLHQEDFCQAAGLAQYLKYEPTEGNYPALASRLINHSVKNPFGDKMMFFDRLLFDFLIGNCDNHLKNHSFLWDFHWSGCELSPLYDITCTTIYPKLAREMGVSLCASRRIDDIRTKDILSSAQNMGIAEKLARERFATLRERFSSALEKGCQELLEQG
ncbi:MAG: HipA domain-containing protein, partial [Coriobacteriaceae bacterium]|nr:HipA domain-containing protein [Coriobacteriaceae bacterium]